MENLNEWLSPDELENEFGIKKSTQAKLRMKRAIPYSKIGTKIVRYSRSKINDWLYDAEVVS
jgi:predicted DNA-binding transcriptional regulator AlpA